MQERKGCSPNGLQKQISNVTFFLRKKKEEEEKKKKKYNNRRRPAADDGDGVSLIIRNCLRRIIIIYANVINIRRRLENLPDFKLYCFEYCLPVWQMFL